MVRRLSYAALGIAAGLYREGQRPGFPCLTWLPGALFFFTTLPLWLWRCYAGTSTTMTNIFLSKTCSRTAFAVPDPDCMRPRLHFHYRGLALIPPSSPSSLLSFLRPPLPGSSPPSLVSSLPPPSLPPLLPPSSPPSLLPFLPPPLPLPFRPSLPFPGPPSLFQASHFANEGGVGDGLRCRAGAGDTGGVTSRAPGGAVSIAGLHCAAPPRPFPAP